MNKVTKANAPEKIYRTTTYLDNKGGQTVWKEHPVGEDLEKAAIEHSFIDGADDVEEYARYDIKKYNSFKEGAQWYKEQMMAKAIDGYVIEDIEEGNGDFLLSADYLPKSMGLKDQQKVKVIVIKED